METTSGELLEFNVIKNQIKQCEEHNGHESSHGFFRMCDVVGGWCAEASRSSSKRSWMSPIQFKKMIEVK
uniref:Uncharacterized protein n=1 Tax=Noccaea caerulescens TaxID=107243 RepID=A0A1J3D733_NOCCA